MKATKYTWVAFLVFVITQQLLAQSTPRAQHLSPKRPAQSYGLPLMFEKNQGQTDSQVQFLSRGDGYSVFLSAGRLVLSLRSADTASTNQPAAEQKAGNRHLGPAAIRQMERAARERKSATLAVDLVGAAKNPAAVGEQPLATKINYFIGRDPKKWRTNVPAYGKVRYKNVYPGIDLVYYGNHGALEYDFDVAAGADPTRIQFAVKGADSVKIDAEGNLTLAKSGSTMRFRTPTIYQQNGGERRLVAGGYVVRDSSHIGFAVGKHDRSQPLVIDPVLVYSTFLGGSNQDYADGIAVDGDGDAYVVGLTNSPDFPTADIGDFSPTEFRMFLVKLNPTGTALLFADYFGGTSGTDGASSLALDSSGNAYITGNTASFDFPSMNPVQLELSGTQDAFLVKIAADGASLMQSTYLGGSGSQIGNSVAVDTLGEAVITGVTTSPDFPTTVNAYQREIAPDQFSHWGEYAFVAKFSPSTELAYSSYLAGSILNTDTPCTTCFPYSEGVGVATDELGNAYIVGNTNTVDYPTMDGAVQFNYPGYYLSGVGFVTKLDPTGTTLLYSTYLGGQTSSYLSAIAVDESAAAYVTGYDIANDSFPLISTAICNPDNSPCSGAIIAKFDPVGSLNYSTYLALGNDMQGEAIQVENGNAIIVGSGNQFTVNNQITEFAGKSDVILAQIDSTATTQVFSTFLGGSQLEASAQSLALDSNRNVYVTGVTQSPDFPVTQTAFQNFPGGRTDAFVTKIDLGTSASAVAMAPWALDFGLVDLGSSSESKITVLRNMGSAALNISGISFGGDFPGDYSQSNDCGDTPTIVESSCTITITFAPSELDLRSATLMIIDDAVGSPHSVTLSGSGNLGDSIGVTVSPSNLAFPASTIGTPTASQGITFTNHGSTPVTVSSVEVSGNFAATSNNCGTVAAYGTCTVRVGFTPASSGALTGSVQFNDSVKGGPHAVALSGSGLDFATSTSSDDSTVDEGGTATYQLSVSPSGGTFASAINFSCNGAPAFASCIVNPRAVTPGKLATNVTVTVKTTGVSNQARGISGTPRGLLAAWIPAQLAAFGLLLLIPRGRKRVKACSAMALTFLLLVLAGCAGTSTGAPQSKATPSGTYHLNVVGTSGKLEHVTPLTLTVR